MSKAKKIDQILETNLVSGEHVVQTAQIHWGIFWRAGAVLILALVFEVFVARELALLLCVVSGLMVGHALILRSILLFVLTNKRVLVRYGILEVDLVDIHFDKIESLELERMIPGLLMGYANLVLSGTGNRYIVIPYVANAAAIRAAYNEMVLGDKT